MGETVVWDGTEWVWQDGYWTTADMPEGMPPVSPEEAPPPVVPPEQA
jgi:hypothetical protein